MGRLVLQDTLIIDGCVDRPFKGTLVIEGSIIAEVGPSVDALAGDEVYGCERLVVCPGLIDSHCHLIYDNVKDAYDIQLARSVPEATVDAVHNARKVLEPGFTTVRDVGSRANIGVAVRDAIAAGRIPGPRVLAAGTLISAVGCLGDMHPTHIFEDRAYRYPLEELITGPWEARKLVRRQVKDGVDLIKTEMSGTGFNPLCPADRDTLSDEELNAIVDEARRKLKPVAVHAESRLGIIKAAQAGVTTIEHGVFLDDQGIELMLANSTALSPTLAMYTAFVDRGLEMGIPEEIVSEHRRTHEHHVQSVQKAYERGVTIIAGGDSGLSHFPQGGALDEARRYVELVGMSPMDALKTLTSVPAKVHGLQHVTGTLKAGKSADFVIFNSDPSRDIGVLRDDEARVLVLKEGRVVGGDVGSLHRADKT